MLFYLQGAVLWFASLGNINGGGGGSVPFSKARRKQYCCRIVHKSIAKML